MIDQNFATNVACSDLGCFLIVVGIFGFLGALVGFATFGALLLFGVI
jgi:hypothetical protein